MLKRENAGSLVLVASLIVFAAILGYAVGHGRGGSSSGEAVRDATTSNTLLEYPERAGWRPVGTAPGIAGLSFTQLLLLAPGGQSNKAGLVAGQLANVGSSPLPPVFLAHTVGLPKTEIVELENTEAFKYSGIETGSSNTAFTLYTIPTPGATQPAVACYAPASDVATMRTCEGIAGSLTITSQTGATPIEQLVPNAGYAQQVGAVIARVEQVRSAMRTGVGERAVQSSVAALSEHAASGLSSASASIALLHPPAAAEQVQSALIHSLSSTGDAYSALAEAAEAGEQAGYAEARADLISAEASLDSALGAYSLLGYDET